MDKNVVKQIVDSFLKMCDYIEESDANRCIKCPVQKDCFKGKHKGLPELMRELGIERRKA